jgi:hypothetical protein
MNHLRPDLSTLGFVSPSSLCEDGFLETVSKFGICYLISL